MIGNHGGDSRNLGSGNGPSHDRNNPALLVLGPDPGFVFIRIHRHNIHGQPHLMSFKNQILEHQGKILGTWNIHQHAQRDMFMNYSLTNIQNAYPILGKDG